MTGSGRLAGKVAVVTGGASGIGAAVVERFRAEGATVAVLDVADSADLVCDVTDEAAVTAAFDRVVAEHGRLDLLVTSAGIPHVGDITTTTGADLDRIYAVNVKGTFHCLQAAVARMGPGSAIVTLASIASVVGIPDRLAYSMSKGAVLAMTYSVATDCRELPRPRGRDAGEPGRGAADRSDGRARRDRGPRPLPVLGRGLVRHGQQPPDRRRLHRDPSMRTGRP